MSTQGAAAQDFTGNKRLLLAAVDRFMGERAAVGDAQQDRRLQPAARRCRRRTRRRRTSTTCSGPSTRRRRSGPIRQLADFMSGVRGRRKALVLFSEGIDYDITDVINNQGASTGHRRLARCHRRGDPGERQHLQRRSAGPVGRSAGSTPARRGRPIDADPTLGLDSTGMQNEVRLAARQPPGARRRDRRVRRRSTRTTSRRRSTGSSRTTAPTTCSATTRPTSGATASSGRSR